jgi:hypothetical protein
MHRRFIRLISIVACLACVVLPGFMASESRGEEIPRSTDVVLSQNEHPLAPVLAYARAGYARIEENIQDYTCNLTRRERVAGTLGGYQHLFVKIRHQTQHQSFSVYLRFLSPENIKDREVIYAPDQRNGDILVRRGGNRLPNMTLQLSPTGRLAMEGNRYPISEIGVKMMVKRIIEVLEEDLVNRDMQVTYFRNAKLNGRECAHFQVVHPLKREGIRYHMARVLVDSELQVPVYFASYEWAKQPGDPPLLLEEYIYSNVRLNTGLTDHDFQRDNPEYGFQVIDRAATRND